MDAVLVHNTENQVKREIGKYWKRAVPPSTPFGVMGLEQPKRVIFHMHRYFEGRYNYDIYDILQVVKDGPSIDLGEENGRLRVMQPPHVLCFAPVEPYVRAMLHGNLVLYPIKVTPEDMKLLGGEKESPDSRGEGVETPPSEE
jgi:hypothetical protein